MMQQRQRGFTLVELMVAMVIGTIIILGAGQLFLTTFQTFQNVDKISRKQENLVFIAQRITREIRQYGPGRYTLECESELVQEKNQCTCTVADTDEGNQPLVSFRKDLVSDDIASQCEEPVRDLGEPVESNDALYRVALPIENNGESLTFHVAHRAAALDIENGGNGSDGGNGNNGGNGGNNGNNGNNGNSGNNGNNGNGNGGNANAGGHGNPDN